MKTFSDLLDLAKRFLSGRRAAYRRTFNLNSVDVQIVLVDLARYCRAHRTPCASDPRVTDRLLGRHEVWLRIQRHLRLTEDELWALYDGRHDTKGDF